MKLKEIASALGIQCHGDVEITGIQYDSRKITSGDLFVCLRGNATDGHQYAAKAVAMGAAALLVEELIPACNVPQLLVENSRHALALAAEAFFGFPQKSLKLIGLTGTNGKTTTTHLIKWILDRQGKKTGLIGTNHIIIGDRVIPATHTTPDSLEISSYLRQMVDCGCEYAVMEVSSHGLKQGRVSALNFSAVSFTNLTQDHLDYHDDFADYLASKQILFRSLDQNAVAVVNYDDPYGKEFIAVSPVTPKTFGHKDGADYRGRDVAITPQGTAFILDCEGTSYQVQTPLLGDFNVYNVMNAIAVTRGLGVDMEDILESMAQAPQVHGRFEKVKAEKGPTVVIDYAHSPDGLKNILTTANEMKKGRVVLVFGCGGDRDQTKRPIMGKIGGSMSDFAYVTSDNPRTEDPASIVAMVEEGVKESGGNYQVIVDRREAIKEAILHAKPEDMVVIAGKGHEDYQILGTEKVHFDDFEEAKKALALYE